MTEFRSIVETQSAFEHGTISPSELTRHYFQRIRESSHNAFLTLCEERALQQAREAEKVLERQGAAAFSVKPLLGIPIGLKDNMVTENVRTTAGSRILENYVPPYSATVVSRLENAGAIILGKLNMDEFAMGGSNENSAFGPVVHPTHSDRVPGGSSGGSACAVRAGLCLVAFGSDTGGSIRLPASYCGVVGIKPTYGRISRYGLIAFASSLDQIGPLTNNTSDADRVLRVISGHDSADSTSLPGALWANPVSPDLSRLRVGVPQEFFVQGMSAEVEEAIQRSLKWFQARGAELVPVSLPHAPYSVAVYYLLAVSEASSNLARFDGIRYGFRPPSVGAAEELDTFYKKVRSSFGSEVKRRIILGTFALSSGYYDAYYRRACQVRRLIKNDFDQAFSKVDVIAAPVAPTTAYRRGEKNDPLQMYLNDIYTIPANLAGLPAISLPCGKDSEGLPIGLQLMAPAMRDEYLLAVAGAFEKSQGGGQ